MCVGWSENAAQVLRLGSSSRPPRRAYHSCVAWGRSLVVFGGAAANGYLDDTWSLELELSEEAPAAEVVGRWVEVDDVGARPMRREGHCAAVVDSPARPARSETNFASNKAFFLSFS